MTPSSLQRYHVFGLLVESELPLNELITGDLLPNVVVKFGKISEDLEKPYISGICYKTDYQKFILKVNGVAQYLVENGDTITIDRSEGGSDEEIRLFLLGSAFGALIHQRGILPLHGSAVVVDGKALLFCGISGAGKSTLAAGFVSHGYKLLADDVCVITLDAEGKPIAHPGYPQMKLWTDSLESLGHTVAKLRKKKGNFKKVSLPVKGEFFNTPLPVKGIYIITSSKNGNVEVAMLSDAEKQAAINESTYRPNFLRGCRTDSAHVKHAASLFNHCFVKRLQRPAKGFYIDELIKIVENDIDIKQPV